MEENKNLSDLQHGIPPEQSSANITEETTSPAETAMPENEAPPLNELNDSKDLNNNMEVHHHAHHDHGKKNWRSYFWEFLMLFLAVFCGFLAELQLEHKIERDREKQYMQSIIEDLAADTSNLSSVIKAFSKKEIQLDTVLRMYRKFATGYNDTLQRNIYSAKSYPDFIYSDRTMQQLKNSGAMRLIRHKAVSNEIMAYDAKVRDLINIDIVSLDVQFYNFRQLWRELIDQEDLETDRALMSIAQLENGNKNYLLKSDKATLGEFNNCIRDILYVYKMVKNKEIELNEKATQLIALIKKEYHLE